MPQPEPRSSKAASRHANMVLATERSDVEWILASRIKSDGGTQMRASINDATVAEYEEAMTVAKGWSDFPPVVVFYDGEVYWLADGFHRLRAYMNYNPGRPADITVPAKVSAGTRRDAILHAAKANANHGLRRTNADKRRAVETLLRDEEWRHWSDAEIARNCAVDPKTVSNIRRGLTATMEIPELGTRIGADGKTRDVTNIGRKAKPEPASPHYAPVWALERWIEEWLAEQEREAAGSPDIILETLKREFSEAYQPGTLRARFVEAIDLTCRKSDLIQAINNVREQRQVATRQSQARAVYVESTPAPKDEPNETIETRPLPDHPQYRELIAAGFVLEHLLQNGDRKTRWAWPTSGFRGKWVYAPSMALEQAIRWYKEHEHIPNHDEPSPAPEPNEPAPTMPDDLSRAGYELKHAGMPPNESWAGGRRDNLWLGLWRRSPSDAIADAAAHHADEQTDRAEAAVEPAEEGAERAVFPSKEEFTAIEAAVEASITPEAVEKMRQSAERSRQVREELVFGKVTITTDRVLARKLRLELIQRGPSLMGILSLDELTALEHDLDDALGHHDKGGDDAA